MLSLILLYTYTRKNTICYIHIILLYITNIFHILQSCVLLNQDLLSKYKLSHQALDRICLIAKENGYMGKLTGFRGGFVYTLSYHRTLEAKMSHSFIHAY